VTPQRESDDRAANADGGTGFQPVTEKLTIKQRDLPHWQVGGAIYFLTFRLSRGQQPLNQPERATIKKAILF
jgi:hypothetical protein